jgi:hypothetical protein
MCSESKSVDCNDYAPYGLAPTAGSAFRFMNLLSLSGLTFPVSPYEWDQELQVLQREQGKKKYIVN